MGGRWAVGPVDTVTGMDKQPRTVKANGITLAYRAWGPQDAPPLLLPHCRGADGAYWAPIAERPAA